METQPIRSGGAGNPTPASPGAARSLEPHHGHSGHGGHGEPMHRHISSITEYIIIFALLMILLALTVGASFINMGAANIAVTYLIAIIKGVLIVMFFMHVRHASKLTWVFSAAAFVWLSVMFVFTFNDYLTRPITGTDNRNPTAIRADKMSDPKMVAPYDPREEGRP